MEKITGSDSSLLKKATNKDVAKLAGVSVATISYVINDRKEMRISEATKKKVLQAINFLNYSPNPYAVGLSGNQEHNIVLRSSSSATILDDMNIVLFMKTLAQVAKKNNYGTMFSTDKTVERLHSTACVCMGFSRKEFYALSNENFTPLISVNCVVSDPIFYQLSPDYSSIAKAASLHLNTDNYIFLALKTECPVLKNEMLETFKNVAFITEPSELAAILAKNTKVAFCEPIFSYLLPTAKSKLDYCYIDKTNESAELLFQSVLNAINRVKTDDCQHYIKY